MSIRVRRTLAGNGDQRRNRASGRGCALLHQQRAVFGVFGDHVHLFRDHDSAYLIQRIRRAEVVDRDSARVLRAAERAAAFGEIGFARAGSGRLRACRGAGAQDQRQ